MKILALEKEVPGVAATAFELHLRAEAARVWVLHQEDVVREIYFRRDWPGAILVLECKDVVEAKKILSTLPLVEAGLIAFEIIPLRAYPGFDRLFDEEANAPPEKA